MFPSKAQSARNRNARPTPYRYRAVAETSLTGSGFQLCIPVEKVHPAFVEVVGRELAPDIAQLLGGGLAGRLAQGKSDLLHRAGALGQVAAAAGGDDVFPAGDAAAGARDDVVEGQVALRAAILAGEFVPQKQVEAR